MKSARAPCTAAERKQLKRKLIEAFEMVSPAEETGLPSEVIVASSEVVVMPLLLTTSGLCTGKEPY